MKVQNALANDEEKTNPKYLVEADGDKVKLHYSFKRVQLLLRAVPIMRQRL